LHTALLVPPPCPFRASAPAAPPAPPLSPYTTLFRSTSSHAPGVRPTVSRPRSRVCARRPVAASTSLVTTVVPSSRLVVTRPCSRSEEHTSELQSRETLVCRLPLENKRRRRPEDHTAE